MTPNIPKIKHSENKLFFLMAGPCVVESEENAMGIAKKVKEITDKLGIPFIFKASYRKANRSRGDSFTGIGDETALKIIQKAGKEFDVPTVTDVHSAEECALAAAYVDVLQIPAFLCRQSDLLAAAAKTGKWVNIKKGQFLSAGSMGFAVDKVKAGGNDRVMLTERGTMLGYHDLVVDYRNIPDMKTFGVPVVLDITHSLQQPNQSSGVTGGKPELIGTIARAGIAAGADGIFVETHPDPSKAKSDGANMLPLDKLEALLSDLTAIKKTMNAIGK